MNGSAGADIPPDTSAYPAEPQPTDEQASGPRHLSTMIDPSWDGWSVEQVASAAFHLTRHAVSHAKFQADGILLDGRRTFSKVKVHTGQMLSIVVGDSEQALASAHIRPSAGSPAGLRIVFEDDDILIVDKQAGITMYPGPGHHDGTLGDLVLAHLATRGVRCVLHPVNRLDKGTSGLCVFATNAHAQDRLQKALHSPDFRRVYLAICHGIPDPAAGVVDVPLGRRGLGSYMASDVGKQASTAYETIGSWEDATEDGGLLSLLRLELATGRTHQIRVHMAYLSCALLGDAAYGMPDPRIDRPALHSAHLELVHPVTTQRLTFDSALPDDMATLVPKPLCCSASTCCSTSMNPRGRT